MPAPAYQLLLSEIIASGAADRKRPVVTIPVNLLKFLLQRAVAAEPFDEAAYLTAYPDIGQAIENGAFANGAQHYLAHGYFEGRTRGAVEVDEMWYRQIYPDVDAAILAGEFASATEHFHSKGMLEWRAPRADAVAALEVWKAMIAGEPLPPPDVGAARATRRDAASAAAAPTPAAPPIAGKATERRRDEQRDQQSGQQSGPGRRARSPRAA